MAWTGAGERAVKGWLAASNAPQVAHLEGRLRSSEVVYSPMMARAGRRPIAHREGLEALKGQLTELVGAIDAALAWSIGATLAGLPMIVHQRQGFSRISSCKRKRHEDGSPSRVRTHLWSSARSPRASLEKACGIGAMGAPTTTKGRHPPADAPIIHDVVPTSRRSAPLSGQSERTTPWQPDARPRVFFNRFSPAPDC